ncbi:hypothetical protein E5S67_02418 [Microcoleus sp. IPMA8]|uniref:Uncharacterized protein n=1 Tax=Microcoleus asticus IPMA8 TaxID=2563858 RepID=A0ABX2CWA3_9CYAN|nr:hypothetical protein [Microcoleus asticus IPMA8]
MSSGFVNWMVLNEPRRRFHARRRIREEKELTSFTAKVRRGAPTNTGSGDIRNLWRSIYLHRQLKLNN